MSWLEASAEGRTLSELLLTFLLRGPNGYRDALMETEDGRGGLSRNASRRDVWYSCFHLMFVASFVYLAARSGADAIGYPLGYGAANFLGALWGGIVACLLSVSLGLYFQAFVLAAPAAVSDAAAAAAAVGSGPAAAHRRIANSSVEALRLPHNSPLPASPDIFAGQDITAMPGKGGGGGGGGSNQGDTAATATPTGLGGLLLSLGRRFANAVNAFVAAEPEPAVAVKTVDVPVMDTPGSSYGASPQVNIVNRNAADSVPQVGPWVLPAHVRGRPVVPSVSSALCTAGACHFPMLLVMCFAGQRPSLPPG